MKLKELFAVMSNYSEDRKKPDPNLCPFLLTIGEDQHNFLLYTYEGDFKSKDGKMNKDDAKKLLSEYEDYDVHDICGDYNGLDAFLYINIREPVKFYLRPSWYR